MRLPVTPNVYDRANEQQTRSQIEIADAMSFKRGEDIEVGSGRLILTNPNGARYEVYVDIDGSLQTRPVDGGPSMSGADAFGRLRVSNPFTLFDCKQIYDNTPLFFDDSQVSGAGTTSTHSVARASTVMGVSAATAGKRIRQSFQRFNYQPGKSMLILATGVLGAGGAGITAGMGYYDDNNGVFVQSDDGVLSMNVRGSMTGSAVTNSVTQANWNGDKLDGTGPSGYTLSPAAAQIWWCDLEWLGVGTVRTGFVIDGKFILCHTFNHANTVTSVYMSTPNLPIRYEIANDGTGGAASVEQICSTVISEGGLEATGSLRYRSTAGTHVDANTADTIYAVVGIRLKSTHISESVILENVSMMNSTSDDFEWILLFNPTVAGTFTYADETNSAVQTAVGATANTVTGGTPLGGGIISSGNSGDSFTTRAANAIRLGASIAGTRDEIVLCVRPLSANADIEGSLTWRELT